MRKLLFSTILAILVLLGAEVLSFLGLSASQGRWASYSGLSEARQTIADGEPTGDPRELKVERRLRRFQNHFGHNVLHPFLGFVNVPRAQARKKRNFRPGAANLGFPDNRASLLQPAREDTVVVGIFGGSVANILANVSFEKLTEDLGTVPRFTGKKIRLVHAALGGFKQPQQLMALNYFLALGGHFDLILNIDGFNEVALPGPELISKNVFPHYPRDWYFRTAALDPALRISLGRLAYLQDQKKNLAQHFSGPLLSRSFTASLFWSLKNQNLDRRISEGQLELANKKDISWNYQTHGPRRKYSEPEKLYEDLTDVWIRSSYQMQALAQSAGAEYFHFLQPNQYIDGSKDLTDQETRVAFDEDNRVRPGVLSGYPMLISKGREAREAGLPFFDLTLIFRNVPQSLYIDVCCHFNIEGNDLLADAIVEILKANPPKG
ncbi:MAG: hypothetical protein K0U98_16285 [Deltaproteobacteria bacterium]|nr:hypothetical protein [Deltaproteobacteria bacterium]